MKLISFLITLICTFITLIGCTYEKRIHIWSVFHASAWNPSKDRFAFARGYKIYKAPTGISRFPDGGISKSLHESISFYIFDTKSGRIQRIDHYDDAARSNLRQFWDITINWEGDTITYSLTNRVWDKEKKESRKINIGRFSFDVNSNKKTSLPVDKKIRYGKKKKRNMTLSSKEIKDYTRNVTVEGWGIDPLDYTKLSNREYIDDLMKLEGDQEYRNAIIERLGKELKPDEIKEVLKKFKKEMDKLKSKDSYKHLTYKFSIEEIEQRLRSIIQKRDDE